MSGLRPFRAIPRDLREWTRWMREQGSVINAAEVLTVYTTAELVDISSGANISSVKQTGSMVFNETTSKPVWSAGGVPGAVWVDATGATVHTPE